MRVTKRTNIALRVLMYCAVRSDDRITKNNIAEACNVSEHHLGQIVNKLAQLGYLATRRGRYGGLALALAPSEISVGSVFRAFEAGVPLVECFSDGANTCPLINGCRLRDALKTASEAFYASLDEVSIESLTLDNAELDSILAMASAGTAPALAPARHAV